MKALILIASLLAAPGFAQEETVLKFTHAHNNTVQPVASGLPVQVQLPASPLRWRVDPLTRNAVQTAEQVFMSPGRVPGSEAVQVLSFDIPELAPAVIILRPEGRHSRTRHRHAGHEGIHGAAFGSVYTLTLEPVVTQP